MKPRHFVPLCLPIILAPFFAVSCSVESLSPEVKLPQVSIIAPEIGPSYVVLKASVSAPNIVKSTGFYISEDASMSSCQKYESDVSSIISARADISFYNKDIYYQAFISNGHNETLSEIQKLPKVQSIRISTSSAEIFEGYEKKLTATVSPSYDCDWTFNWTSSNPGIVKVSSDGTLSAVGLGSATVTASFGSVSANCQVKVIDMAEHAGINSTTLTSAYYDGSNETVTSTFSVSTFKNSLPSYVSEYGIALVDDNGAILTSCSSSESQFTFSTKKSQLSLNKSTFKAFLNNGYFQTYVTTDNKKILIGSKQSVGMVYNYSPEVVLTKVTKGTTSKYSSTEGSWDKQTTYTFDFYLDGALFIDKVYEYYISGWVDDGRYEYTMDEISDKKYSDSATLYWHSTNTSHHSIHTFGAISNGTYYDASKSIDTYTNSGSISFSLISTPTTSTTELQSVDSQNSGNLSCSHSIRVH